MSGRVPLGAAVAAVLCFGCSSGSNDTSGAETFGYADGASIELRVGDSVSLMPTGGAIGDASVRAFSVSPPLPEGLSFDGTNGAIAGSPAATAARATYRVAVTAGTQELSVDVELAVGLALPVEVASLEGGFEVVRFAALPQQPGKFATAPDGRIFVNELLTGQIRIIARNGQMEPVPFATVTVETGGHRGLLGLALSPDFENDGFVYASAVLPAAGPTPAKLQVLRWREGGGVGLDRTVILDDLPVSAFNNGGALAFDSGGQLLVTVGDVEVPASAQDDAALSGKLLRVRATDGGVPTDNPDPASRAFAKGFRNTWAVAVHPTSGAIYAADNGPTDGDELNLVRAGFNYEWGADPDASFGAQTGPRLRFWSDVVVPTGLAFRPAEGVVAWPAAAQSSLFGSFYDQEHVVRFELSGEQATDIDREVEFLQFAIQGNLNKPIDVQFGPDGSLFVLTNGAVFRVTRVR